MPNGGGEALLGRLMDENRLLEPIKPLGGVATSSLQGTKPTFRGTWVLKDPNLPIRQTSKLQSSSIIVVQVDWTEDEDGEYEKMATNFYMLEQSLHVPKENMDLKLLELAE